MCFTKKIIKELNSIINRFIWKGSDKIKHLALISDYIKNGGLRMPHIKTLIDTQRIICLKKYIEEYDRPWKHFLSFFSQGPWWKIFLILQFQPCRPTRPPSKLLERLPQCLVQISG